MGDWVKGDLYEPITKRTFCRKGLGNCCTKNAALLTIDDDASSVRKIE